MNLDLKRETMLSFINAVATALSAFITSKYEAYYGLEDIWKLFIALTVANIIDFLTGWKVTHKDWKENGKPKDVKSNTSFNHRLLNTINKTISQICLIMLAGFIAHSAFENKTFTLIPFFGHKTLAEWVTLLLLFLSVWETILNLKHLGIDIIGRIKEISQNAWNIFTSVKHNNNNNN